MPVRPPQPGSSGKAISQRDQYQKGGIGRWYWDYRDKIILENIGRETGVILDAGCGEGITLEKICRAFKGRPVIGIDALDENIALCQKHGLPAQKRDLGHLEMPEGSVGCCVLSEVIEHLKDPGTVLREIRRVLRPGGRLIIVFPNDPVFKLARLMTLKFKEAFYDPGHLRQWTPWDIRKQLADLGFRVEILRSVPFLFWPISLHGIVVGVKKEDVAHR